MEKVTDFKTQIAEKNSSMGIPFYMINGLV
jgi:hypothetical protein